MPRPKAKKTTPVAMETVPIDSEFLTKAVELLILMSPTYPGFPSLTLAEKIQKPALEELFSDVYAEPIPELKRQYEALKEHIRKYPDAYPITSGRI